MSGARVTPSMTMHNRFAMSQPSSSIIEFVFSLQSNINTQGFRSLREGEPVEFDVEGGPDGRNKAVNVTGPSGSAPQVLME